MTNNPQNQFAPLTAQEKAKVQAPYRNKSKHDEGSPITPVPDGIDQDIPNHPKGSPAHVWHYLDAQEKLLFSVCRFVTEAGKDDRPLTYRQYQNGSRSWAWKGLDRPRPLYGLNRLAKALDAPVLVCEGEKAADAAQVLFPDHVAITSPNGAGSPHCADWTPLQGRIVTVWPDNDSEGRKYAENAARLALVVGAQTARIVQIPDGFPEKWDLADTIPTGFDLPRLRNMLESALPYTGTHDSDDFESLQSRAASLTRDSHPDDIGEIIEDISNLGAIAKRKIMEVIKRKTGIPMEAQKSALNENADTFEPDQLDIANGFISEIGRENLLSTTAHVWHWENIGTWKAIPERRLKQLLQTYMAESGTPVSRSLVDNVADVTKSETFMPAHEWDKEKDVVNVLNGELRWNGGAWELHSHCREHYLTTQIPHKYDPQADCPRFKQFLQEIFAGDADAPEKERALLEMIGYTLTCHTGYERFILLVGGGANGKSVVLDIIRLLVGTDNVCAVQPSEFGNKFQRAHLHLKLANLVTEIAEGATIADAELKSIVSGELTTAEHKNKDPFDFRPYATCWFGTNHMPHTRDFSDAVFRRALVIPFNNTFKAGVADPHLKEKLAKELSGILNMALQAYGQVLQRNYCTEPQSCLKAKEEWRTEADQVAEFISEMCEKVSGWRTSSKELYEEYEGWAKSAGINRKLGRKGFTNRLLRHDCELDKSTGGIRMIAGIRLRSSISRKE